MELLFAFIFTRGCLFRASSGMIIFSVFSACPHGSYALALFVRACEIAFTQWPQWVSAEFGLPFLFNPGSSGDQTKSRTKPGRNPFLLQFVIIC